jgi:hypothetical protein
MIRFIIGVCLMMFICGCKESESEILAKAERIKYSKMLKDNPLIKNKNTIVLSYYRYDDVPREQITTFEFEEHEYFMYEKDMNTRWAVLGIAHKGNCKNCKKENK